MDRTSAINKHDSDRLNLNYQILDVHRSNRFDNSHCTPSVFILVSEEGDLDWTHIAGLFHDDVSDLVPALEC